jgi:hypothetical protein
MSLTIVQIANDLATKLGFADAATSPALAWQDIVVAINGAMQQLGTAGQDFFTRQEITLTLAVGTAIYNVPVATQSIIGPVRWNNLKPLRALTSEGEYDQFARIFQGATAYGVGADGDPIAYFVKYLRSGTSGDVCAITIRLAPAPSAPPGTLVAEVVNDAPSYGISDLTSSTVLPVAQNYTESVFLPIARMLVTRSSQFSRPDLLAQLTSDYGVAMQRLAMVGGFPNTEQPEAPRETKG